MGIHVLWEKVGTLPEQRKNGSGSPLKSRKGLGYGVGKACRRPRNVTVRYPLENETFTFAVLEFLGNTGVRANKERVTLSKGALQQPANCS